MGKTNGKSKKGNWSNSKRGSTARRGKGPVRGRYSADSEISKEAVTHNSNNPAWYAINDQILRDTCSIPFSHPLGVTIDQYTDAERFSDGVTKRAFPGVMSLGVTMLPGVSKDNSSPINVAARNVYSFVVHANSRNTKYNSPDVMMYLMAADSCYALWAHMVRAYSVLCNYKVYNKYYAQTVFNSMGLIFSDFQNKMADFRAFINMYAHKLSKICVPGSMTYMVRHMWMFSHLWKDSESKKAQTYLYVPDGFWEFDERYETGGRLVFEGWSQNNTFENLITRANRMLSRLIESEDCMIMSGDILKAFGPEKLVTLGTIPEGLICDAEYDPAVCSQIQNAFCVGRLEDFDIHQDPTINAIICEPKATGFGSNVFPRRYHLNLRMDAPTPADVVVATRLMVAPGSVDEQSNTTEIKSCGSEIVTTGKVWYYQIVSNTLQMGSMSFSSVLDSDVLGVNKTLLQLVNMEKFDWHPTQYVLGVQGDEVGVSGDVDNYTRLNPADLDDMHHMALVSQFNVPTMGPFAMR